MREVTAIVEEGNVLRVSEELSLPLGAKVKVSINGDKGRTDLGDTLNEMLIPAAETDYDRRIEEWYRNATPEMLEEERRLNELLSGADAPLPPEEPWW